MRCIVQCSVDVLRVDRATGLDVLEQAMDPLPLEEQPLLWATLGLPGKPVDPRFSLLEYLPLAWLCVSAVASAESRLRNEAVGRCD